MAKTVRVTNVRIQYEFGGETFTVEFPNPSTIDAIVFARTDVERLKAKQREETGKAVDEHRLDPGRAFPAKTKEGVAVFGEPGSPSTAVDADARSLWWHTSSCSWFHPEVV